MSEIKSIRCGSVALDMIEAARRKARAEAAGMSAAQLHSGAGA